MNDYNNNIHDLLLVLCVYVQENYHYYMGFLVRMMIDWTKFKGFGEIFRFCIISIFLIFMTKKVLSMTDFNEFLIFCIVLFMSIMGSQILNYIINDVSPDALSELKKRIINAVKKK
jgi:hypothetical protein